MGYKVKPNLDPSSELSYLLGVRYGDGQLSKYESKSNFIFGLLAKDKPFVDIFKTYADKIVHKNKSCGPWQEKHGYWLYHVYSKAFYEFLTKSMKYHKETITAYPADFLRGYFDSEGTVVYSTPIAKRKSMSIDASSKDFWLIQEVSTFLRKFFAIESTIYKYSHKGWDKRWIMFHLRIRKQVDQKKFLENIGFSIPRKQNKLQGGI